MGIAFAAGSSPVTYTPKFAYVGNLSGTGHASVSGYTVDAANGALSPIPGSPFPAAGSRPRWVAVDPSGRFAYAVNSSSDDVSGYLIDATTGVLTAVTGSPFAAGGGPQSVAVDPSGRFAYVANFGDNTVSGYTINTVTGALTPRPPLPAHFPVSVAVDPTGRFAYVTNLSQGKVSGYTINATSGALVPIRGSPFAGAPSSCIGAFCGVWSSVTVDPTGKFAYVVNHGASTVAGFTINATTGALTPIAGSPFAVGAPASSVAVDPSGEFAYVATNIGLSAGVEGYTINATTGALTAIVGSPFGSGTCRAHGDRGFGGCDSVTVDPSGKFAYYVFFSGLVYGDTINGTTGALTAVPGSPFASPVGFRSASMAVSGAIH
jgi:6-phosphogluconolactonase (cycloisomerase 2 family)